MAEEMNMGEVVMVVDDNKEIVYSISELLKYEGYRVIPAYDGMEALNLLEQNPVDLILLDVMMPRLKRHIKTFRQTDPFPRFDFENAVKTRTADRI